jgi:hypothetical protein
MNLKPETLKFVGRKFLPKLAFIPKVFENFNLRRRVFFQNYTHNIVAVFYRPDAKNLQIHSRRARNLPLLSQVNGVTGAANSSDERVLTSTKHNVSSSNAIKSISPETVAARLFRPTGTLKFASTRR